MKATILSTTLNLPREDWLALRRQGLGGSDAGIVMGQNPWTTRLQLWKEKTGILPAVQEETEAMVFGRALENVIIDQFQQRTGKRVFHVHAVLASRENPFMIANLDGRVVGEPAGFEAKTAFSADYWEDGMLPPHYYAQVQHYMAVCGFQFFYVAVLIQGRRLLWMKVDRDQNYIDNLVAEEAAFWQLVEAGIPPEPTPEEAVRQLELDYPKELAGLSVEIDRDKAEQLLAVKRTLVGLEQEEQRLRAEILGELRGAETGIYRSGNGTVKVSWRLTEGRVSFDTDQFRKDHADLWTKYQKQAGPRRASRFIINAV